MALKKKPKLKNCSYCGKVFVSSHGEKVCPNCMLEQEEKEREIVEYVREHQGCSMADVMKDLSIGYKLAWHTLTEGSFSNIKSSMNVSYSCQSCGKPIRSGTYCSECLKLLRFETKKIAEQRELRMNLNSNKPEPMSTMSTIEKLDAQIEREIEIILKNRNKKPKRSMYEAILNEKGKN